MSVSPPRSLQDIPGLGPIRIRSLVKAGYTNLALLQSAEATAISTVPGMSEAKAEDLVQYLAQFETLPNAEPVKVSAGGVLDLSGVDCNRLQLAVAETLCRSVRLLLSPQAPDFRPRLLKSLERLSIRLEALSMDASSVSPPDSKKISAWLQTLSSELPYDKPKEAADRKVQAKLSEMIDSLCEQLKTMEAESSK